MKVRWCSLSVVAITLAVSAAVAEATQITVLNHSFEDPDFGPGGYGPATDWVGGGSGGGGGFQPIIGTQTNSVPDGIQVGFAGNGADGSLFQDLGVAVTSGASYTLTLYVGSQVGFPAVYLVELLAGSTTIGSASGSIVVGSGDGDFSFLSISAIGSGSGNLGIRLSQTVGGGQTLFDDVHLSVNAVPEPSSVVLLGSAAVGLVGLTRRRRRSLAA